jgi:hypothetical protein
MERPPGFRYHCGMYLVHSDPAAARLHSRRPPGFALAATLMLLGLLTTLAVGLLSLSAIGLRAGGAAEHRRQAEANARLALLLAIGELQQHAGPDRRVTAEAAILEHKANSVKEAHWTGVWRTTREDGASWYERGSNSGGTLDHRWTAGWAADNTLAWLVSGNEAEGMTYEPTAGSGADSIELVSAASAGGKDSDRVTAPRVALAGPGERSGGYAWWVGDAGIRANVATPDRFAREKPEAGNAGGWRRVMMAQDCEHPDGPLAAELRAMLVDRKSLELAGVRNPSAGFHDFTTGSAGVLSNPLEGGLKRDLTVYLESGGVIPAKSAGGRTLPGVSDGDNLVGPANPADAAAQGASFARHRQRLVSPKFGLLRDWASQATKASLRNPALPPMPPKPEPSPGVMADSYDGTNPRPVAIKEMDRTSLMPVLTEASMYYSLSYYDRGDNPGQPNRHGLRIHLYPRAVLWNPYNAAIQVAPSALCLFVNGSKTFEVELANGKREVFAMTLGRGGAQRGSLLFALAGAALAPGQCLVFSPTVAQAYPNAAPSRNQLSSDQAPDVNRFFHIDSLSHGPAFLRHVLPVPGDPARWSSTGKPLTEGALPSPPIQFREVALSKSYGSELQFQADDYRMLWKSSGGASGWSNEDFDKLPMAQFVSCALQYGDNDELPVVWSERLPVLIEKTAAGDPTGLLSPPDRRTRDGFRLRWFTEHPSNQLGAGSLAGTPLFDTAPIANWNVRATYSLRSPWENLSDSVPAFFGAYTRDLFDDAVSWHGMQPMATRGGATGFPFGQPIEGPGTYILFDVPLAETGIVSPGMFQHVKMSEFIWHPSYAFGNSLVDPRIGRTGTELERRSLNNRSDGGWNRYAIGWANDGRSDDQDKWAFYARSLLQNVVSDRPGDEQTVSYDLSFELNHSFWDRHFLSAGDRNARQRFISDPFANPLPNGRLRPVAGSAGPLANCLGDLHLAASCLLVDGAFNVNSTRKQAWKALLLSTRDTKTKGRAAFPRLVNPPGSDADSAVPGSLDSWTGFRSLTNEEADEFAEAIVTEVKTRGPFLSLGDFVNRRLKADATGDKGALQAAIDRTSINRAYDQSQPLDNKKSLPDYYHRDQDSCSPARPQPRGPLSRLLDGPARWRWRIRRGLVCRQPQAGIAEQHEFHPLEKDAGRHPGFGGLEFAEFLLVHVIAQGAVPAIAQPGCRGDRQLADEAIHQREPERLAAGIATDVGHPAGALLLQQLFAEASGIHRSRLERRGRQGRRGELLAPVRPLMGVARAVHVGLVRWQRREMSRAATGGNKHGQAAGVGELGGVRHRETMIPAVGVAMTRVDDQAGALFQDGANRGRTRG